MDLTCTQVENLVAIELAYINTKHPDFAEAYTIHRSIADMSAGDSQRTAHSLHRSLMDKQAEDGRVTSFLCHWNFSRSVFYTFSLIYLLVISFIYFIRIFFLLFGVVLLQS